VQYVKEQYGSEGQLAGKMSVVMMGNYMDNWKGGTMFSKVFISLFQISPPLLHTQIRLRIPTYS
jgi:hypothetical protein